MSRVLTLFDIVHYDRLYFYSLIPFTMLGYITVLRQCKFPIQPGQVAQICNSSKSKSASISSKRPTLVTVNTVSKLEFWPSWSDALTSQQAGCADVFHNFRSFCKHRKRTSKMTYYSGMLQNRSYLPYITGLFARNVHHEFRSPLRIEHKGSGVCFKIVII